MDKVGIGIVGLGDNTRQRHVPGLLACEGVELRAVCNRRKESTRTAAREFDIPYTFDDWNDLVECEHVDAVVIGTWPYLHCPITLAALRAGKHVLTEARMAMDATEAGQMLEASQASPELVTQIVPSPFGLTGHKLIKALLENDDIGELREFAVLGTNAALSDPGLPIHWRQQREYSGLNMLALGILHEPLIRWIDDPVRVFANTQTFTKERSANHGNSRVTTPDSVHILTELSSGASGIYHLSGVIHHGPSFQIHLYGSKGTLKYMFAPEEQILLSKNGSELTPVAVAADMKGGWRVEEEFIGAIRGMEQVKFTTFELGRRYMKFTEAVARSAESGNSEAL